MGLSSILGGGPDARDGARVGDVEVDGAGEFARDPSPSSTCFSTSDPTFFTPFQFRRQLGCYRMADENENVFSTSFLFLFFLFAFFAFFAFFSFFIFVCFGALFLLFYLFIIFSTNFLAAF